MEKINNVSNADKKRLSILAHDFLLTQKRDRTYHEVKKIIENCKSYEDGRRKIMAIYDRLYI